MVCPDLHGARTSDARRWFRAADTGAGILKKAAEAYAKLTAGLQRVIFR
jgi:hypothetical protein